MEAQPNKDISDTSIDIDIGGVIDEYLKTDERPRTVGVYFPSEIGSCIRRSYYSYTNPKPFESSALRIFALGNNLHSFIASALKASKEFSLVEEEKPIKIEYTTEDVRFKIYGRIDDYVITKNGGKKIIIEAKTVSEITKVTEPELKHIMQVMLYLNAEEADYGMLVYADKKNLTIRQFKVDYDYKMYEKVMTRFKDLDFYLKKKKLPPAEYYFDDKKVWECKYCPYFEMCMKAIANDE